MIQCGRRLDRGKSSGSPFRTDVSKWEEQELNDDDRQAWFGRRRPDGFAVNEKEHIIYVLEAVQGHAMDG
jgi:hypothetical protein